MHKLSRKEREKEQRRNEILNAAQNRFFKSTYDEVSMEDIANDVELAKGTLYLYFKNKQSLFFTVVIKGLKILRDIFKEAADKEKYGKDKILSFSKAFFDYIQNYGDYYRLNLDTRSPRFIKMFEENEIENAEEYLNYITDLFNITKDSVVSGINDKSLRQDLDPIQTSIFLGSSIKSAVFITPEYEMLLKQCKITKDQYFDHSLNIILNGIEHKKSP